MKKHGVVLDMRNNQLSFWPGYCQHAITKPCAAEPHDTPRRTILKRSSNATPELLLYLLPSTPKVSKVLSSVLEAVIPQQKKVPEAVISQQKKKPNKKKMSKETDKKANVEQLDKPLNLALIGAAPFI